MLLATMSGQKGIAGFITSLQTGIQTGTPTVKAAAMALATSLGSTLNLPFNGSVASVKAIGKALNALPASVLATLAGKTHQYSAAVTDATTKTKAATTSVGGLLNKLVSVGTNLLMVGVGFKLLGVSVDLAKVAMVGLETVGILAVAAGLYELIHHFGVLHGLMIGGAVAVGALTVAFIALDAVPVVALIAAIGLAIVGLVAGIVDLVTHFGTVKHAILAVFDGANMWLNNIGNLIMQGLFSGLMAGWHDVTSFFGGIGSWIKSHKGPPSADAVLLIQNGQLIMQGLGKGLLQGFRGNVQPLVAGMAGQIRTGMGGALPGVGMGGRGGMGGSSQTNYFHNEVTVQGGGGNPQQVGQAVDKVMTAHTATVLRALRAGSGSNY